MRIDKKSFSLLYLPLLIRLKCCEDAQLPAYLGSTLRGALGWALLSHPKTYQYIFENRRSGGAKQDISNPYIIEPPRFCSIYFRGDELCFKLILLGEAAHHTKDVIEALVQAQHFGLGANRKIFEIVDILHGERFSPIWQEDRLDMSAAITEEITAYRQPQSTKCSILFLTPLRIRHGGTLLMELDFATIIRSITRRLTDLTERYGGFVNAEEIALLCERSKQIQKISSSLYLSQISRYTNRRNEQMDFSGILGALIFEGNLSPFSPWLEAARILHIGRNTTFGCGQIDVVSG